MLRANIRNIDPPILFAAGELGCFNMRDNTTQPVGCHYNCENPDDCKQRNKTTNSDLPTLTYVAEEDADICLCIGDNCNSQSGSGMTITLIVLSVLIVLGVTYWRLKHYCENKDNYRF